MLRKFLRRILGLFLIAQTVLMFVREHASSHGILDKILLIEALIFLTFSPWFFKASRLISITLIIAGISIVLMIGGFAFIKPYYTYLVFLPAIVGFFVIMVSYLSKSQKS